MSGVQPELTALGSDVRYPVVEEIVEELEDRRCDVRSLGAFTLQSDNARSEARSELQSQFGPGAHDHQAVEERQHGAGASEDEWHPSRARPIRSRDDQSDRERLGSSAGPQLSAILPQMNRSRVRMHAALGLNDGVFVRVVYRAAAHQLGYQGRLARVTTPRDEDRYTAPANGSRVDEGGGSRTDRDC